MFLAIHNNNISENYGQMLAFRDAITKLSNIVGEEVSPSGERHLNEVDEKI